MKSLQLAKAMVKNKIRKEFNTNSNMWGMTGYPEYLYMTDIEEIPFNNVERYLTPIEICALIQESKYRYTIDKDGYIERIGK